MKMIFVVLTFLSYQSFAAENSTVQVDIKFLCAINKIEKSLLASKVTDLPDLVERISAIKQAGVRDNATKEALKALAVADPKQVKAMWKDFAKQNKVDGSCL